MSSKNPHRDPSKLSSVLTTIQHWSFRPCNRPFAIAPVQSMTDWDTIDAMRASKGLSSDFRLMICYDLETNNVVDHIPFHLHKRCSSMVCFLPSVSVIEYCAMQYDMVFSNQTGHSRPAQLTGVNRTTKWYHNKLERRHYMATIFELLKGEYGYLYLFCLYSTTIILSTICSFLTTDEHPNALDGDTVHSYLQRRCYRVAKNVYHANTRSQINALTSSMKSSNTDPDACAAISSDIEHMKETQKFLYDGLSKVALSKIVTDKDDDCDTSSDEEEDGVQKDSTMKKL